MRIRLSFFWVGILLRSVSGLPMFLNRLSMVGRVAESNVKAEPPLSMSALHGVFRCGPLTFVMSAAQVGAASKNLAQMQRWST
jgi:hypothetical protein